MIDRGSVVQSLIEFGVNTWPHVCRFIFGAIVVSSLLVIGLLFTTFPIIGTVIGYGFAIGMVIVMIYLLGLLIDLLLFDNYMGF